MTNLYTWSVVAFVAAQLLVLFAVIIRAQILRRTERLGRGNRSSSEPAHHPQTL